MKRKGTWKDKSKAKKPRKSVRKGYYSVPRSTGALTTLRENKYFDTAIAQQNLPSANGWLGTEFDPTANTLFAPIIGAGINQRIGRQVLIKKIMVKGAIHLLPEAGSLSANGATIVRLSLVQDLQTNGTQMQGEQLWDTATGVNAYIYAFMGLQNIGRFKVLKDKYIKFGNHALTYDTTGNEIAGDARVFKFNIKFRKPVKVNFNLVNGGTVADIVDNSFHIIANTFSESVGINLEIDYRARVIFYE